MSCPYVQLRLCSFVRGRLGTPPGRSNATTVNGVLFYNCVILSASVLSGANPVNAQVKKKGVAATASVCTTTGRQGDNKPSRVESTKQVGKRDESLVCSNCDHDERAAGERANGFAKGSHTKLGLT